MNREHNDGDNQESLGEADPIAGTDSQGKAGDRVGAAQPTEEGTADQADSEARAAGVNRRSGAQEADGPDAKSPQVSKDARNRWKQWGGKFWAAAAAVVIGAVGAWLGVWLAFFAGPPAPVASPNTPIGNPGHPPGRQDVSTMAPGHRFYAVANFFEFQSCGRPCWLPLYQLPTQRSADITQGWPCEYYEPGSTSSGPYCLQPLAGRTPDEMADPADKNSGDRILVVCQVTRIANGQAAETIRNEAGQSSNIWDMVAVPASNVSRNSVAAGRLSQVPGMPGSYETYGPDIWLGNTGWHGIPCR